jgi:hypothetical protein
VDFGQLPARVLAAMSELVEQLLGCPSSDVEGAVFGDIYMAVYRQHSESLSDKPAEKNRRKTSFCDGFYHHYAL